MRTELNTLLVSSLFILTTHQAFAEQIPMQNNDQQAPGWAAGQVPITWGDCVPVPVIPIPGGPYQQIPPPMSAPIPMQGAVPIIIPNNLPSLLPPPSPFFNIPQVPAPSAPNIQAACDNSNELKLHSLQTRYDQGAAASKKHIDELRQTLEDTQNQMTDSRSLIESLTKEKSVSGNAIKELNNTNITLKSKLSALERSSGDQARKLTALGNKGAVLAALQSSYKERSNENADLKKKIEILEALKTEKSLLVAQGNKETSNLQKELDALNSAYLTLQSKHSSAESKAGAQARKLTALGQSATELTALKSAYKERNDENVELKKKIEKLEALKTEKGLLLAQDNKKISELQKKFADLNNAHITLKTKLSSAESSAGAQSRKLTALGQSATELTALKSAYKERNDENVKLKKQIATLDALKTEKNLLLAQDDKNIAELQKKLTDLENAHITLKTKLSTAESSAGAQARKLTALGQSATELTALQSAYKERNEETRVLKSKLEQLKNSLEIANACKSKSNLLQNSLNTAKDKNKSLLGRIGTLESQLAAETRKVTALTTAAGELIALKSAYKDLSSKKANLSEKLDKATADTDQDGVLDNADKCPSSPVGAEVDATGCLADADKDGIVDSRDNCPTSPANSEVNEEGCPKLKDGDGDKVADASDLCPNTEAGTTVNEFGCAPTESITLEGVNFDTGSARLTATSLPIIEAAAKTILQNPNLEIQVSGYTDNQGGSAINQQLSQRRANTVMIELIKNGVKADALSAKGYGEKNPVASNATNKGRATNRRVELKIL